VFRILLLLAGLTSMPCRAEFRDPTQPAYPLPSATANDSVNDIPLVLSAIWISPHSRRATINGVSARQGQTIVIGQTPALKPAPATPETGAATGVKQQNTATEFVKENAESPLGHTTAPPHAPQPLEQSGETAESVPERSNTIKIISIRKNSVIIAQNGELKTLQLVQRPYKTINSKYTRK
jgi:hypothetical protein